MKGKIYGEYYFKLKKFPQIQFKATKYFAQERNDLSEQLHKYLFESWNFDEKNKFKIVENRTEEGFLEYRTYIEINTFEELIEGTEIIIKFLEYEEKWNREHKKILNVWQQKEGQFIFPLGQMYLMKEDKIISPYNGWFQTSEDIRSNAKKMFLELQSVQ